MRANVDIIPGEAAQETQRDMKKGALLEIDATKEITTAEHELGFWGAVNQYPSACFCVSWISRDTCAEG
jgi:hypothetical protein